MADRKSFGIALILMMVACVVATGVIVTDYMLEEKSQPRSEQEVPLANVPLQLPPDTDYTSTAYWESVDPPESDIELQAFFTDDYESEKIRSVRTADVSTSENVNRTALPKSTDNSDAQTQTANSDALPPQRFTGQPNAVAISAPSDDAKAMKLIREGLPNATKAEQQIWLEQLDGMSPAEMRFLIDQRKQLGSSISSGSLINNILPSSEDSSTAANSAPTSSDKTESTRTPGAAAVYRRNIANVKSIGYRRQIVVFAPARTTDGFQVRLDLRPMPPQETNRKLDLAINGAGFMQLKADDGSLFYCRSAAFFKDDKRIILEDGKGTLELQTADDGQVLVFEFPDATQLKPIGRSLLQQTNRSGQAEPSASKVMAGYLEPSNVQLNVEQNELGMLELSGYE